MSLIRLYTGPEVDNVLPVHKKVVVLTNAQIKTLPDGEFPLVAAPGVGKILIPTVALLSLYISAPGAPYIGVTTNGGQLVIRWSNGSSPLQDMEQVAGEHNDVNGFLTAEESIFTMLQAGWASLNLTTAHPSPLNLLTSEAVNKGLALRLFNIGGTNPLTGGNVDNTLTVTVLYSIWVI